MYIFSLLQHFGVKLCRVFSYSWYFDLNYRRKKGKTYLLHAGCKAQGVWLNEPQIDTVAMLLQSRALFAGVPRPVLGIE